MCSWPGDQSGRVLLLACGALAREILALKELNGWDHLDLECLPAQLHLYPERIRDAVADALRTYRQQYDTIFVAYADCGTGGKLAALCREFGVEMLSGAHCYAFYSGVEHFAAHADAEIDVFFLTDFLVRQFDAFVIKPLGLDRHPELRDTYFGNYRKLVYLAQIDDTDLDRKAAACARRLALDYERRSTGYGDLETAMAHLGA